MRVLLLMANIFFCYAFDSRTHQNANAIVSTHNKVLCEEIFVSFINNNVLLFRIHLLRKGESIVYLPADAMKNSVKIDTF